MNTNKPYAPYNKEYLHLLTSDPGIRHAYQTLLSSFYIHESARPLKTFLVTSTQPEEGKTTVSVNLALIAMLAGKTVLLVDADFRKPRVHDIFRLDNKVGLGDLLTGSVGIDEAIQVVDLTHETPKKTQALGIITSGSVSSTNIIINMGSPKLKALLDHLSPRFDMVVLDSPPVLSVSDPLLLASMVEGTILVMATGAVTVKDAKRAKERLEQAGGHVLGVVLNHFNEKLHGSGVHPYAEYYNGTKREKD